VIHSSQNSKAVFISHAVFRLLDTCVVLQDEMEGFYKTASLEKVSGIENVFKWLRKRGIKICLYSDLNVEDTKLILDRLGWSVSWEEDPTSQINLVMASDSSVSNPIKHMLEVSGSIASSSVVSFGDTVRFLQWSWEANTLLNVAVTYGSESYRDLATAPHHGLLDSILETPNFLLGQFLSLEEDPEKPKEKRRLGIRRPFFL
jgi:phosphoglycolate phosphatase-like HAD superfamily hydrolase